MASSKSKPENMKESTARDPGVPIVLVVSLGAFTLWDYYFGPYRQGFRLFDLMAVGLILIYVPATLALKGHGAAMAIRLPAARCALLLALVALFIVSGVIGSARDPANFLRPTAGIWLGMAVFLVYYCVNVTGLWVGRVFGWLIIVHALALYVQFAVYTSTGVLINYQQIIGAEPRVFSSIFRPSGLFLEPSSYSETVIMLLLLRWIVRPRLDWISWIALVSVVLTVSLFGVLAVFSILVFFFWKRVWFWLVAGVVVLVATLWMPAFSALPGVAFQKNRLLNITSDASVLARHGGLVEVLRGTSDVPRLWFGSGLGTDYAPLGASGGAFLVASVGIVGALLWLAIAMGLSPHSGRIRVLFALLLVLVAASIWTMMFWWAWLGLLLNRSLVRSGGRRSLELGD